MPNYEVSCSDCEHFIAMAGGGYDGYCPQIQEALRQMGMPPILPMIRGSQDATNCDCFEANEACQEWKQEADAYNDSIEATNRQAARELSTCR